ncbi:MAG TPA: stalk domain-containing protein, partial [Clostridia bacterium]|nr:stalk domain-containing protein [Clostridia bacterium]
GTLTYTFQWQRSANGGTTFVDIPGATDAVRLLTPADNLCLTRLEVTCTDDGQGLPLHQSTVAWSGPVMILNASPVITEGLMVTAVCDEDESPASFGLTLHATDPDAIDTLTWSIATMPGHGSLTLPVVPVGASLVLVYHPAANWHGVDTFRLRVEDGLTGSGECTVTVVVNPRNDPPVNTAVPVVVGAMISESRVHCTDGVWNDGIDLVPGSLTCTYQWVRARSDTGRALEDIPGATSSVFILRNVDIGWYVGARVTFTDTGEGLPLQQSAFVLTELHAVVAAGTTPPSITFPSFATIPGVTNCSGTTVPSFTTTEPSFALSFTIEDDSPKSVHWTLAIGDRTLFATDGAGSFTRVLSLAEGLNDVEITAEDASGNQACRHLHITLDTHAPEVTLVEEVPQSISSSLLILAGSIHDDLSGLRQFSINGEQVIPYADGTFRESLTLKQGENTVLITTMDNAGNRGSRTVRVICTIPVSPKVSSHTMTLVIGSGTMTVDGSTVSLDSPAVLREDRTLVPLRAIVEHLGGTVAWNAKTRQVTVKARGVTIVLTIGRNTATVNGKTCTIDPKNAKVVPVLSYSRTLLPLRFVAEQLGLEVAWDAGTRTITLTWTD